MECECTDQKVCGSCVDGSAAIRRSSRRRKRDSSGSTTGRRSTKSCEGSDGRPSIRQLQSRDDTGSKPPPGERTQEVESTDEFVDALATDELISKAYCATRVENGNGHGLLPDDCPFNLRILLSMADYMIRERLLEHYQRDRHGSTRRRRTKEP